MAAIPTCPALPRDLPPMAGRHVRIDTPTSSQPDTIMLPKSRAGQHTADWDFWTNRVDHAGEAQIFCSNRHARYGMIDVIVSGVACPHNISGSNVNLLRPRICLASALRRCVFAMPRLVIK